MAPRARSSARASLRALAVGILATLGAALAAPHAEANSNTLRRSVSNILFAPFDIAASPVTAGKALYENMQEADDPTWKRIAFPIPGYIWILGVQIGGGAIREIAGLLEFAPGLGLLFSDAEMDPLFDPAERNQALVDFETRPLQIKFGVNYVAPPLQE